MTWLRNLSLRARTFVLVALGLTIMLFVYGSFGLRALQQSTDRALAERLNLARLVASHIDHHIDDVLALLERTAASEGVDPSDEDPEPERAALRDLFRSGAFSCHVFVADAHGIVLLTEPHVPAYIGEDRSGQPHIAAALLTGRPQVSNSFTCADEVPTNIGFAVPITDGSGKVIGLIGGVTDPRSPEFAGMVADLEPIEAGDTDVVDGNGFVLGSTDPSLVALPSHHREAPTLIAQGTASLTRDTIAGDDGAAETTILAFAPLRQAPWGVIVAQSESAVLAPVTALRQQWAIFGAILVFLTVLLTWGAVRAVSTPILQLLDASRRLGAGDLRTPVAVTGRDEVGELARGFEAMRQRLAAWGEQMEAAVQKRTRELSTVYAVDRAAAQTLDLDEILNVSMDKVLDVLEVEAGGIYLLDPDGETMRLQVHRGLSRTFVENVRRIQPGEGISGRAVAEGQPVVLDVPDYPTERLAPYVGQEGFQTLASTPLLSGGQRVGALNLATRRMRAFPPEDMELLSAIGRQLGGAVQNARLFAREKQLAHYLRSLNEAMVQAMAGLEVDKVAQTAVQCLVEKCSAAFARLWLTDEGGEHLILCASAGLYTRLDGSRARVPIADDTHKLGVIARDRTPRITNRVQEDPSVDQAWAAREGLVAFAGYPVLAEGQLLGVIVLFSRQPLIPEMLDVLGALVNQVSIALTNARLFEAAQRRAARLAALQELGIELAGLRDEAAVLSALVRRGADLAKSSTCTVMLVDGVTNEAVLVAQSGLSEASLGLRVPLVLPIIRRSLETGEPILVSDIDRDAPALRQVLVRQDIHAFFAFPMIRDGRPIGYITLSDVAPRRISADETTAYRLLADRAAAALESARLYSQTQQSLARITSLYDLSSEILATTTVEETLARIAHRLIAVSQAHSVMFNLMDADGHITLRLGVDANGPRPPEPSPRPAGTTLTIFRTGKPIVVTGLDERRELINPRLVEMGIAAFIGLPLKADGRVVGVLFLRYTEPHQFSPDEIQSLAICANQTATALEKARLVAGVTDALAREQRLDEVAHTISASLDLEAILPRVVRLAAELVGAEAGAMALVEPDGETIVYPYLHNLPESLSLRPTPKGKGLGWQIVQTGQPVLLADYGAHPAALPHWVEAGVRSFLGVPLTAGSATIGALGLFGLRPGVHFAEHDVAMASAVARQAAVAAENARLFRNVQQRLAELSALFTVSSALRDARTADEMLPIILNKTLAVMRADAGALFCLDEASRQLVGQVAQGRLAGLRGARLGLDEGVCGHVVQSGAPYPFADLEADPHTGARLQPFVRGVQGGICVPLQAGDHLVGSLIVGSDKPRTFSDDEVRLLTAIADMASSAIRRATLFEELEGRVRELTVLFAVGKMVTASLRIQDVLEFVVGAAAQAIHCEATYLFLWDEREQRLVLNAVVGYPVESVGQARYRLGEGLAGWVYLHGQPANAPDLAADPRWLRESEEEARLPSGTAWSALVVPLKVPGKTLGVLGVVNKVGAPSFAHGDESLLTALAGQMAVAIENARLYEDVRGLSIAIIRSLATAIDARDPYTRGHSEGVSRLAVRVARELGWAGADLEMLEFAALLHDVGKIAVPDAILRKAEPLTPDEWTVMRLHPYHSAQIVKPVEPLKRIGPWIYHHHERWDGAGYPDGLKGEAIPLGASIISLADTFNAMTTDRPYRKARSQAEAVAEIERCAGTQFDPVVADAFLRNLEA